MVAAKVRSGTIFHQSASLARLHLASRLVQLSYEAKRVKQSAAELFISWQTVQQLLQTDQAW